VIETESVAPVLAPLDGRECESAAGLLARAFCDNQLNRAVIGNADPAARIHVNFHGMRLLLPSALTHGRVSAARDGDLVTGVLIGIPPGAFPLPAPPWLRRIRCLAGQGWRVAVRWGQVFRFLEERHPVQRHWYLGTLGVEPAFQRRGIGGQLLAEWLHRVDLDGVAAYLETDVAANVEFYARAAFQVSEETEFLGATIWRMLRAPESRTISTARRPQ
jgi:ribosomal protein S18 acetylase RimI-like enzyme